MQTTLKTLKIDHNSRASLLIHLLLPLLLASLQARAYSSESLVKISERVPLEPIARRLLNITTTNSNLEHRQNNAQQPGQHNVNHDNLANMIKPVNYSKNTNNWRIKRRHIAQGTLIASGNNSDANARCLDGRKPAIFGLRCDERGQIINNELTIQANEATQVTLIGQNLDLNFSLALTPIEGEPGDDCTHLDRIKSVLVLTYVTPTIAQVDLNLPTPGSHVPYYMCIRELKSQADGKMESTEPWFHQGSHNLVRLYVHQDFLPLYMKLVVIFLLLMLSGLFSGLNLGLMALDKNELQVIISCGSDTEKRYARAIEPVRRRGNYLLCSILFSNVLVNSTIAVLLEELTSGIVAVMVSTIFIVMFGEILPQAFCSRHGLAVGAKTVSITYLCMILTAPLSYPVSVCLDWALGEELSHAYDRERLMEFIRITRDYNNLETDEVNIISGALKLKRVKLDEVMTRIEDVFMLDVNSCLDFDTIKSIVEQGYSRIPVHEPNNKRHILALLFAKDLALLDPDDRTPVQTLISFYNHPVMFMFEDTTLDSALNEFKTGKSHMAFIRRVIDDGDRDPVYEITGIVTLEDVIEEIMQIEINDETDTVTDNRRKRRRKEAQVRTDFAQFTRHRLDSGDSSHNVCVTPQLCLAAYQFLSTNVEPFSKRYISDIILKRLLAKKIYFKIRVDTLNESTNHHHKSIPLDDAQRFLFIAGEPVDYFIMILEGRVSVTCGCEELSYEAGPFSYFGKSALVTSNVADAVGSSKLCIDSTLGESRKTSTKSITSNEHRKETQMPGSRRLSGQFTISMRKLEQSITNQESDTNQGHELSVIADKSNTIQAKDNHNVQQKHHHSLESIVLDKINSSFVPDYTVRAISDISYLKIGRLDYLQALRATLSEQRDRSTSTANYNDKQQTSCELANPSDTLGTPSKIQ